MIRLLYTLRDIGLKLIIKRIFRNLHIFTDNLIPEKYLIIIYKLNKENLNFLKIDKWPTFLLDKKSVDKSLDFKFLNEFNKIYFPINWHNNNFSRLWNFNLHYFDWARDFLEKKYLNKDIFYNNIPLAEVIDSWILNNKIGTFDGWHSYTLSLRIRNWIWLFQTFPELINKNRINSLWNQIKWLDLHKEEYLEGNHLLENLITLTLSSLFFSSRESENIFKKNFKLLNKQLDLQILKDGGHYERSASYHILILDRLVELAYIIYYFKKQRPSWLLKIIKSMNKWAQKVSLSNNQFPRFNDSPKDGCPEIDSVINFANSYIFKHQYKEKSLRDFFQEICFDQKYKINKSEVPFINKKKLVDLKQTGWTILRPDNQFELVFKCGESCPKELPGHVHSDLLSFDLFRNGEYFFAEAGTSSYSDMRIRDYERSGSAHNLIQLAIDKNYGKKENISWIEPVDIWDTFKAGRKAKIIERNCGHDKNDNFWVIGAHDGFRNFGASHKRFIKIGRFNSSQLKLQVIDSLIFERPMLIRQWWHLGPKIDRNYLEKIKSQLSSSCYLNSEIIETEIAEGFGVRKLRSSLSISGLMPKGKHKLSIEIIIK